jgi:HEPN domain-containing protein
VKRILKTLGADPDAPDWVLGFHSQQAVAIALKAVLARHSVEYPRTHNLEMLLELLRRQGLDLPPDGEALGRLTPFGVTLRYDDPQDDEKPALDRVLALRAVSQTIVWADALV